VAAEYEVNIKLNTQEINAQLKDIDRAVKNIGKGSGGGGSRGGAGAGIAKQLSLFTADSIFGRGRITGTALKNVKLSWLGAFDEIQDVANTIGGRRSTRLLNVRTSWGKAFEGLAKNAKVLELGGLNTQTSWGKALTGLQDNAKVLKLGGLNTQTSWTKALTGLQNNAKVLDIQNLNVRTSWGKALEQLSETAEIIAINAATVRAQFLAGAPIPGLAPGQTAGPARPPVQGAAFPIGGTAGIPGSPEFERALAIGRFRSSPIEGAANIPGSPKAKRARRQRLEQVGLGAGFPLLFGGGAGSVIGGAAGGLTGSFGAQIAFSAIGQQVDTFVAGIVDAGKAFGSLEEVLSLMSERSLFTSKSSEELAQQLQELGDVEALAELSTIELASKIGSDGIEAFQDLETEVDQFDRLVGHLMISLQAFVAGPLGDFLEIVNATLGKKVTQGTIDRLAGSLQDPADQARFRAAAKRRIGTELEIQGFGMGGLPRSAEVLKSAPLDLLSELSRDVAGGKFGESNLLSRPLRITQQDRKSIKPPKNTAADKAAREEQRLQERLAKLDEERQKVIEISRFKDQIAAAEAAGDQQLVIRLEGEQRIAEIEARRKKDLIGVTKQKEIEAINIGKATEKLAAQREVERELEELQRQRQEKFDDTIENLEYQLKIAQATSEAERERLRIEKELQKLRKDGMSEEQAAQVGSLMKQISAENSPLNKFIKQSVESLNDLEMQAVQISQGIGNAIGNSLVGGIQNLITGAATVKEVFADLLKSVADVLAKQAAEMIATYIAIGVARLFAGIGTAVGGQSSLPGVDMGSGGGTFTNIAGNEFGTLGPNFGIRLRANGGPVFGGSPMLVGERGPELFVPFANGEITSSESLGAEMANAMAVPFVPGGNQGGITSQLINRQENIASNRQENTQINRQENLRQLSVPFSRSSEASMVAAAEQQTAEAISNPAPLDVRFESQSINGVEYVTAEQHQSGMAQAAQRGRALTLAALQNSVKTRRRVGL